MSDYNKVFRLFMHGDVSVRRQVQLFWLDKFGGSVPLVGPEKEMAIRIMAYISSYRVPPSLSDMRQLLADEEDRELTDLFEQICKEDETYSNIEFLVDRFAEEAEGDVFDNILEVSKQIRFGSVKIGRDLLEGPKAAIQYVQASLTRLGGAFRSGYVGGNLLDETADIMRSYRHRKDNPELTVGFLTGLDNFDVFTRGLFKKQFVVILGAAGAGKSIMLDNMIVNMSTRQGINCALSTKEMPKEDRRTRMICIHSYHEKFAGKGYEPLKYNFIKHGELDAKGEEFFEIVLNDLADKDNNYGVIEIFEAGGMTFDQQRTQVEELHASHSRGLEFFGDDMLYHTVATPLDKEMGDGNALSGLFKRAKQMSLDFSNREGIVYVTPHHANRDSISAAEKTEEYEMTSGRSTSEIEQSADIIMWILRLERYKEQNQVRIGVPKGRDSGTLDGFFAYEDFTSSFLGNLNETGFLDDEEGVGVVVEELEL